MNKKNLSGFISRAFIVVCAWVFLSIFSSMIKDTLNNCGKEYPVGYIIYTNLFCEIETNE